MYAAERVLSEFVLLKCVLLECVRLECVNYGMLMATIGSVTSAVYVVCIECVLYRISSLLQHMEGYDRQRRLMM